MKIDLRPTLIGPRLLLRPQSELDWNALYLAASDPLIWEIHPAHDRWQESVFRSYFDEGLASGGALVIVDRSSNLIIGSSRYFGFDPDTSSIEIGWTFLARAHWGGSCNRELKRLMLRHIFSYVETATFRVGETNLRSRRAMEKIGGQMTDQIDRRVMAGIDVAHVISAIRKADFFTSALHLDSA
jgi:N-acetyltransferase